MKTVSAAGALAVGLVSPALAQDTLRIADTAEPPHLDGQVTTADLTSLVDLHIMETLYALDSSYQPQPLLATGETVSDDGKTITISLNEGITFHDGSDLTSEDVVASLDRWMEYGGRGKIFGERVDSVEATGDYEITINFNEVFGPWKNLLAYPNGGPLIYPSEVVADQGGEPLSNDQIIGTGPYQFNEWRTNRYIELTRYEDYWGPEGEVDGYAGRREANFETLQFVAVPDVGTRVSGVQAGDYDYAELLPGDLYESLKEDDSVQTVVKGAPQKPLLFFNNKAGIFADNYALRRAVQTALDHAQALRVAVGPEDLWDAQGSLLPEGSAWYTKAGLDAYGQGNAEKARQMAKEAGYEGEPIRYMVSSSYPLHYDTAQVYEQQLAAAGFNIDLQVYDWATLTERRSQPDLWDMFETHHGGVPDPILFTFMNDNYPGWWDTPEETELENALTTTTDPEKRQEIWSETQALVYKQVPVVKAGDVYRFDIAAPELTGLASGDEALNWPRFWGVSME